MAIRIRLSGTPLLVGATLMTLIGSACQTTPRLHGRDTQVLARGRLAELNPTDIAVAPVRLLSPDIKAPVATIRRAAQIGLAKRRYSPLSTELVDDKVAQSMPRSGASGIGLDGVGTLQASYMPGDLGEDAVFEVTVLRWDDRNWEIRRSINVAIEARMVNPRDPLGPVLWAGRLDRVFDVSGKINTSEVGSRALQIACEEVFRELLAPMPARDPEPRLEGGTPGMGAPEGAGTNNGSIMGPSPAPDPDADRASALQPRN